MIEKTLQILQIDNIDLQILSILMNDATTPYTEIAKELVVSSGTVHVRMKKLQELGIVTGSNLLINPQKIGYDVCAFIGIYLQKGSEYHDAVKKMQDIPEVVELHYTTGVYSMFAKVVCRDTNHLRAVLNEKLQAIEGIQRTETIISLEESIKRQISLEDYIEAGKKK
ncbi:Lrp/AsnC family transcriptional regulator for asnA, asnC and gidA [Anseongella ginsenosidimutans]|uniref:Lrp/AsnC family transcriptional regulator for asnA, asnC and gidA n=1 Tax=Anseongella ginsenosidimutans TaxID=496056 RepID=A0A4R3KNP8_9SPHI|nr:Lrp/AsnC ligand binding domain-containing protein [Anseongella ginsenosidimutans]QEC52016.1 winged helix-turn-helix transcriptional regulator [Anseongella ginsenosidimutans]TCS85679.1 Lrp/AsnC family transcriptional regulator for asnA, asnC and gidA [Anseongella ginsenosidimutans]